MRKLIYIFSVMFLALFSCQEDILEQPKLNDDGETFATVSFSLDIPDYSIKTKTATDGVNSLSLMTFDENNKFLGKVDVSAENSSGTARVSRETKYIHFIANYEWSGFNEGSNKGKAEEQVIVPLATSSNVFWGRAEIADFKQTVNVSLLRNFAKVTVEVDPGVSDFSIGGYGVYHYASKGTVATYNENRDNTFVPNDNEVLTLPDNFTYAESEFNTDAKYPFESPNTSDNTTYVIVQNSSNGRYYKIHLLNSEKKAYKIERNFNYKIIIKGFTGGSDSGAATLEDAKASAPANNLYAEILKESPIISDADGNRLVVDKLVHLFTSAATLRVQANYYVNGSSLNNAGMTVEVLEDESGIFSSSPAISNGLITVGVSNVANGQKIAKLKVSKGVLSREITVVASELYSFTPYTTPISYSGKDADVTLNFTIPETYPEGLYPVKCKIHATSLYPTGNNRNMLIVYENETYYYMYEATSSGNQTVTFKSSLSEEKETVTIENESFTTAEIQVNATMSSKRVSGTLRYATGSSNRSNISTNTTNKLYYSISGGDDISFTANNGTYTFNAAVGDNEPITLTYIRERTNGSITYQGSFTLSELNGKSVTLQPVKIEGTISGFDNSAATVNKVSGRKYNTKGNQYGQITISSQKYYYTLPPDYSWDQHVRIYQGDTKTDYLEISDWLGASNLNMSKEN